MIGDQVLMTNITNKHAKHDDHDGPCKDSFRTYLKNTAGTDLTKNNMLHDTLCNMYDAHIDATALIHLSDRGNAHDKYQRRRNRTPSRTMDPSGRKRRRTTPILPSLRLLR